MPCGVHFGGLDLRIDQTRRIFFSPSFSTAVTTEFSKDLLPLPLLSLPTGVSVTVPPSAPTPIMAVLTVVNRAVEALNFLASGPARILMHPPRLLSPLQIASLGDFCRRAQLALSHVPALSVFGYLPQSSSNPSQPRRSAAWFNRLPQSAADLPLKQLRPDFRLLVASRVSLPGTGEGARSSLLDLLPDDVRSIYADPTRCLRAVPPTPRDLRAIRQVFGVAKGEYGCLVDRLLEAGMIEFRHERPVCVNGLFGVPKDATTDRLIIDCRRANRFFIDPPDTALISPAVLADTILLENIPIHVGKADVSNMYHVLKTPPWMATYFGLPPLRLSQIPSRMSLSQEEVWPVLVSLPMGFHHAVFLAHTAHHRVISRSLPQGHVFVDRGGTTVLGPSGSCTFSYIDDHGHIAADRQLATELLGRSIGALLEAQLPDKPSKREIPGQKTATEVLGLTLFREGWLGPSADHLDKLLIATQALLQRRAAVRVIEVRRLVGSWIWVLLLHRPLLSILEATYVVIAPERRDSEIVCLPQMVTDELTFLVGVVPFLWVDLHTPVAPVILATDACLSGGAVCVTRVSTAEGLECFRHRVQRGWSEVVFKDHPEVVSETESLPRLRFPEEISGIVASNDWGTVISTAWQHPDDIAILEGQAVLLGFRWMSRQAQLSHSRPVLMIDSTALLGALVKGRSSVVRLNNICRRVAALSCASSIRPAYLWIPSAENPADGPSRRYE